MQVWFRALSGTAVLIAVAMRVGERRVVESLEGAGAVDPGTAKKFPDESFIRKWHFRRLLNAGVVGETMDQAQYIKIVEYVAYQHRRRMRALAAVGVIALLGLVLYFTAGCTRASATGVVRSDSAGVEIVTISAGAIAAAPEWQVDTATHLWTIGGGDDPAQEVDRMSTSGRLANGDLVVGLMRPGEIRVYPSDGGAPRILARGGEGPGEFKAPYLLGIRRDTLLFWDYSLRRLTRITASGSVAGVVTYAGLPENRLGGVSGVLDDGRVFTSAQNWEALSDLGAEGVRKEQSIFLLSSDGLSTDSLPGPPGSLLYMGVLREGGHEYNTPTGYHLDGSTPVFVRGSGYTVSFPETPELRYYDATGALHRIVRPGVEMRQVTSALKEAYIAHDSAQYTRSNPQMASQWLRNLREGRFVERLAAFERIKGGPNGEQWLERSWLSFDSVKQFIVIDSTGMVTGKVTLPMSRTITWIGTDEVLAAWKDEDDVVHLSLHPLHRTSP